MRNFNQGMRDVDMDMTNHPNPETEKSDGGQNLSQDPGQDPAHAPGDAVSGAPEAGRSHTEENTSETSALEESPEERIKALEEEVARLKSDYLRVLADAENTRRMAQKKIEDNTQYALNNFAKDLLAVADNLGRALSAVPGEVHDNDMLKTLVTGVGLTEKELLSILSRHGITRLSSHDQPFNPHHHQAMQEVERTDVPTGTVVQVHQEAWMIHDRLLRPAMVVVSKGGPKRPEAHETPEGSASPQGKDSDNGSNGGIDMSA